MTNCIYCGCEEEKHIMTHMTDQAGEESPVRRIMVCCKGKNESCDCYFSMNYWFWKYCMENWVFK